MPHTVYRILGPVSAPLELCMSKAWCAFRDSHTHLFYSHSSDVCLCSQPPETPLSPTAIEPPASGVRLLVVASPSFRWKMCPLPVSWAWEEVPPHAAARRQSLACCLATPGVGESPAGLRFLVGCGGLLPLLEPSRGLQPAAPPQRHSSRPFATLLIEHWLH